MPFIVTIYEIHRQHLIVRDADSHQEAMDMILDGVGEVLGESEFISSVNEEEWTVNKISDEELEEIEEYE